MSNPEIRVVIRTPRTRPFQPTPQDPESGIRDILQNNGQETLIAGNHRLICHPASTPHHPTALHLIHWVAKNEASGKLIIPWNDTSWQEVSDDSIFLAAIEKYIQIIQETNSPDKFFFLIGFLLNDTRHHDPNSTFIKAGIQSQWRMHIHQVPPINQKDPFDRYLNPAEPKDKLLASLFLNAGGERAIQLYSNYLADFGKRAQFVQKVGLRNTTVLERTIFIFDSLQEALINSLTLQAQVQLDWMVKALIITSEEASSPIFPHAALFNIQFAIPGFLVIFPSEEDRIAGQVDQKGNVWVLPFANCGGQSILSPGGVVLENKKE